ncbi:MULTISPECIES: YceD family protein [Wohlfahrtiimonas]|uniref:YceD family protein n=1 Tax=Wohlfahrtiimonas TaxID=582472 RepID=UPI0003484C9E|nr:MULTISPECIES: YceD family protein [Wohlfahrtiimonas]
MKYAEFPLRKTVNEGRVYDDALDVELFPRLRDAVHSVDSPIRFRIQGETNALGQKEINGNVEVTLSQICQRCLEPFETKFDLPIHWIPVKDESEQEFIGDDEAILVVDEDDVNLLELLEDELLLALPLVPKHDLNEDCEGKDYLEKLQPQEETRQPFAELAELLKK